MNFIRGAGDRKRGCRVFNDGHLRIILLGMLGAFCCMAFKTIPENVKGRVTVVGATPAFTSGVIEAWIGVTVAPAGKGASARLFLRYLTPDQPIPRAGETCTFSVRNGDVSGLVGTTMLNLKEQQLVDSFHCDPTSPSGAMSEQVTVADLNAHPEKFDGKRVTVPGWVVIGHEARYLTATKHASRDMDRETCISVINGAGLDTRERDLHGKHVLLSGIFREDVFRDSIVRLGLCNKTALDLENKAVDGNVEVLSEQ